MKTESLYQLPESYSFKSIWRITLPILIALVMEELLGMTDTSFLGRVGEIELGASDIALCWTADGVYSLCIWIQCVVYIHRKKWLNKAI